MDLDGAAGDGLLIDCDECVMQATDVCRDCIVTFLCAPEEQEPSTGAVVIDAAELRALRLLRGAGMAPGLRHTARDERCVAR